MSEHVAHYGIHVIIRTGFSRQGTGNLQCMNLDHDKLVRICSTGEFHPRWVEVVHKMAENAALCCFSKMGAKTF